MNRKSFCKKKVAFFLTFILVIFFGNSFNAFGDEISFELPDSLSVTYLKYDVLVFNGKERLIFELKVKNLSDEDHRYRMIISLKDGTSAGMLIPRKGKPPVIKSGQVEEIKLPLIEYSQQPDGITISFIEFQSP